MIFATMVVLAALLTSGALFWSRKMIVQPLAIIGSHFDSIAAGNPARPVAVYGRNGSRPFCQLAEDAKGVTRNGQ